MKPIRILPIFILITVLISVAAQAQEKPKPTEESKTVVPLRIQIVISEYEGEKKLSSFPYSLLVNGERQPSPRQSKLRMGIRVPVAMQGNQFQYQDVGTDLDCSAQEMEEGRYKVALWLRRSSVYAPGPEKKSVDWNPGDQPLSGQPLFRQFSGELNLLLRDGQTIQSTMATDPVSGRVVKVDVTLSVVR